MSLIDLQGFVNHGLDLTKKILEFFFYQNDQGEAFRLQFIHYHHEGGVVVVVGGLRKKKRGKKRRKKGRRTSRHIMSK